MLRRSRRGANAIEFALTLPVFMALSFGMMEFGYYFSQQALMNSYVARSCRAAALIDSYNPPTADGVYAECGGSGDDCVEKVAENKMTELVEGIGLECADCTATVDGVLPERYVKCELEVPHKDITGFFSAFFPTRVKSKASARLEWQRAPE